jgi:hypothetical protein
VEKRNNLRKEFMLSCLEIPCPPVPTRVKGRKIDPSPQHIAGATGTTTAKKKKKKKKKMVLSVVWLQPLRPEEEDVGSVAECRRSATWGRLCPTTQQQNRRQ